MREVDKAYAAGFFDGEGHVRCDLIKGYPHLVASASQVDPQPLDWLKTLFGGRVYRTGDRRRTQGVFNWQVNTTDAYMFLDAVLPYLMVKKADAEEAIKKWNER